MPVTINYDAPPTMGEFQDDDSRARIVVGPIGSGKSSGCVMELLRRATMQEKSPDGIRRTRWLVTRNTKPQLETTTRKTFDQWIPSVLAKPKESPVLTYKMRWGDVECEVIFMAFNRAADVGKALSLEITGAYINEIREMNPAVVDAIDSRCGRYPSKKDGGVGASWYGWWADTNAFHVGHWLYRRYKKQLPPKGHRLFEQPDGLGPDAENVENLPGASYDGIIAGKDREWVDEFIRRIYPASDRGSIFGRLLDAIEKRGAFGEFEHRTKDVFVSSDLGINDAFALFWWVHNAEGGVDVIDWYENSGKALSHYLDIIEGKTPVDEAGMPDVPEGFEPKRYEVAKLYLPHDARARSLQTGKSTVQQCGARLGRGRVAITPELSIKDGLVAARELLERPTRFHKRVEPYGPQRPGGFETLRSYRREWDDELKVFSDSPLHDWASNTGDCWRYVACAAKAAEVHAPEAPEEAKPVVKGGFTITVDDDLFGSSGRKSRRRIG
jgi:hypothetical protein